MLLSPKPWTLLSPTTWRRRQDVKGVPALGQGALLFTAKAGEQRTEPRPSAEGKGAAGDRAGLGRADANPPLNRPQDVVPAPPWCTTAQHYKAEQDSLSGAVRWDQEGSMRAGQGIRAQGQYVIGERGQYSGSRLRGMGGDGGTASSNHPGRKGEEGRGNRSGAVLRRGKGSTEKNYPHPPTGSNKPGGGATPASSKPSGIRERQQGEPHTQSPQQSRG